MKIIRVSDCYDCPYCTNKCRGSLFCIKRHRECEIGTAHTFPPFCPLDDLEPVKSCMCDCPICGHRMIADEVLGIFYIVCPVCRIARITISSSDPDRQIEEWNDYCKGVICSIAENPHLRIVKPYDIGDE